MARMTRHQANKEILKRLEALVDKFPDWRFNQILQNTYVTVRDMDMFYDEPTDTLERMKAAEADLA